MGSRCTSTPECSFFTVYNNGWCQLSTSCPREATAIDGTAITYEKKEASKANNTDDKTNVPKAKEDTSLCTAGIRDGKYCCTGSCGTCGGDGCASRPGGFAGCCHGAISASKKTCLAASDVACLIQQAQELV